VATAGATVAVAAGHYSGQTLTGTKSAPGVVFALDANASLGDISGSGQLNVRATNVEFVGGQIPAVAMSGTPASSHVTFRNVNGGRMWIDNASSDIAWIGGDLGPNQCSGVSQTYLNTVMNATRVTFDGVAIHDQRICVSGEHSESLRLDAGSSYITVRNSRFYNNDDSTSAIFVTTTAQGLNMPHDLTVENNFFGRTAMGCCSFETQNPNVTVCTNYVIQYNSFAGNDSPMMFQCPSANNVKVHANVGSFQSCSTGTWTYNVMQWSSRPSSCDGTNRWVSGPNWSDSALGYVDSANADFHLLPTSPALDAGDPVVFPLTDIDGDGRPLGGAPDAGANEAG